MPAWHVTIPEKEFPHAGSAYEALRAATQTVVHNIINTGQAPDALLFGVPFGSLLLCPSDREHVRPKRRL
jgi:hypothetical protein